MRTNYMKPFKLYLKEAEHTKTATKPGNLDDLLSPKHSNLLTTQHDAPIGKSGDAAAPSMRKASQSSTLQSAGNIHPSDDMRNMLGRMRDIETDDADYGYPTEEPNTLPDITTENLPAIASGNLRAAGVQSPEFHQVANLPGNMSRAIRAVGRQLFGAFTSTPTEEIYMIGNVQNQGPNTAMELNSVTNWIRENSQEVSTGDIDFDNFMPGYRADIHQYTAGGIRWMLVRDQFGQYIYSWPESDSIDSNDSMGIEQDTPRLG